MLRIAITSDILKFDINEFTRDSVIFEILLEWMESCNIGDFFTYSNGDSDN